MPLNSIGGYKLGVASTVVALGLVLAQGSCENDELTHTPTSETATAAPTPSPDNSYEIGGTALLDQRRSLTRRALELEPGPAMVKVYKGSVGRTNGDPLSWVAVAAPDLCDTGFDGLADANGFALIEGPEDMRDNPDEREFQVAYIDDCDGKAELMQKGPAGMMHVMEGSDKCLGPAEPTTCAETFDKLRDLAE